MSMFKLHSHAVEKVTVRVNLKDIGNVNFVMETSML